MLLNHPAGVSDLGHCKNDAKEECESKAELRHLRSQRAARLQLSQPKKRVQPFVEVAHKKGMGTVSQTPCERHHKV